MTLNNRDIEVGDLVVFCPRGTVPKGRKQPLKGRVLGFVEGEERAIVRWQYPYSLVVAEPRMDWLLIIEGM